MPSYVDAILPGHALASPQRAQHGQWVGGNHLPALPGACEGSVGCDVPSTATASIPQRLNSPSRFPRVRVCRISTCPCLWPTATPRLARILSRCDAARISPSPIFDMHACCNMSGSFSDLTSECRVAPTPFHVSPTQSIVQIDCCLSTA